ncbi:Isopentenyl-diphosphate delta-isomerase [uncultured archaeon]|nr:Isopentenyl-diphosphate delta-isomerase [uncultured archaeon]
MAMSDIKEEIQRRKEEHVGFVLKKEVQNRSLSPGFEDIQFGYSALPEIDFYRVDIKTRMFGKDLSAPLMIDAMTGGYPKAKRINRDLAEAAEETGIAFAVGSQRAMIEEPILADTYKVRDVAPNIPILGNIGAVNLKERGMAFRVEGALKAIDADALQIHLNPLQEIIQPEGDRNFEGCLAAIERARDLIDVPIVIKEVGSGITGEIARRLEKAGARMINVSGAGGTSWGRIESLRHKREGHGLSDVGIPTAVSLIDVSGSVKLPIIASGGVRSGVDAAKSIMLGASYAAAAFPFLAAWDAGTAGNVIATWKEELQAVAFLTGSRNLKELAKNNVLITGRTRENLRAMQERGKWTRR